mmetsp:Transcript_11642/g.17667  ORF Transcript_11642/g.17667 Transcript_11642/m.17667 type:complete len:211 (-) Transcript_11642:29-661(-)
MLYSSIFVAMVVLSMLGSMLWAIMTNENNDYEATLAHSYTVFFLKFPCSVALHFVLYPEVAKGMNLMKFANNQNDQFVTHGAEISFCLGCIQVFTALFAEAINLYMLTYQHTVQHCIIHFVALEVIMDVSNMYFESLMSNKLKAVMHHPPQVVHKGRDISFADRSLFHKIARLVYKLTRLIYVGFIFYYVPFVVFFLQWTTEKTPPLHVA